MKVGMFPGDPRGVRVTIEKPKYIVTTFDVCCQGFERLRSRSEFILVAYPSKDDDGHTLKAAWLSDFDQSQQELGDFEAARACVETWCQQHGEAIDEKLRSTFSWRGDDEPDDDGNPLCAFLYVGACAD